MNYSPSEIHFGPLKFEESIAGITVWKYGEAARVATGINRWMPQIISDICTGARGHFRIRFNSRTTDRQQLNTRFERSDHFCANFVAEIELDVTCVSRHAGNSNFVRVD